MIGSRHDDASSLPDPPYSTALVAFAAAAAVAGCGAKTSDAQQTPTPLPPDKSGRACTVQKSECPQQSIDDYAGCVVAQCDAKYKMCLGDAYAAGNFGGPCKAWIECGRACANCDQACLAKCSEMHYTGDCKSCVEGPLTECVVASITSGACKLPCVTIGTGCDGLKTCCGTLDGDDRKKCEEAHKTLTSVPNPTQGLQCDQLLSTYKMTKKCTGVNTQSGGGTTLPGPKPTTCSKNGAAATVKFVNNSMKSITLWWVDFACVEKKYPDIAPGKSHDQGTFVGHPWRLRDTATKELLKDYAGATMPGMTTVEYP